MATSQRKPRLKRATAQKRAAQKITPRNWWRLQAGRFKDDPTFADFVAQVQAARKLS